MPFFRLVEVQEKLKSTLAEMESLRVSNNNLKEQLLDIRKEMETRSASANKELEVRVVITLLAGARVCASVRNVCCSSLSKAHGILIITVGIPVSFFLFYSQGCCPRTTDTLQPKSCLLSVSLPVTVNACLRSGRVNWQSPAIS